MSIIKVVDVDNTGNQSCITYIDEDGNLRVKRTNFENYENLNIILSASEYSSI